MDILGYIWLGIQAVFQDPDLVLGLPVAPVTILFGFGVGISVGATPGLAGSMAMAISLPILLSTFDYTPGALLPVLGFLIG